MFFREVNLLGTPLFFSNGSTPALARLLAEERSEEYDTFMEEKGSQKHLAGIVTTKNYPCSLGI